VFRDKETLKHFLTLNSWTRNSLWGFNLEFFLPDTHMRMTLGRAPTTEGKTQLTTSLAYLERCFTALLHPVFRGTLEPLQRIVDPSYRLLHDGFIRILLEDLLAQWHHDVATNIQPTLGGYTHLELREPKECADYLYQLARDLMVRMTPTQATTGMREEHRPTEPPPHTHFWAVTGRSSTVRGAGELDFAGTCPTISKTGGSYRRIHTKYEERWGSGEFFLAYHPRWSTAAHAAATPTHQDRKRDPDQKEHADTPPKKAPVPPAGGICMWHYCGTCKLLDAGGTVYACRRGTKCRDTHTDNQDEVERWLTKTRWAEWSAHPSTKAKMADLLTGIQATQW
jgi:hypothetical protein